MFWRIEVENNSDVFDAQADAALKSIKDLGQKNIKSIKTKEIYILYGDLKENQIKEIAENILVDKVIQTYSYFNEDNISQGQMPKGIQAIEIAYNLGVMDPWEESITKAINDIEVKGLSDIKTAKLYLIETSLDLNTIKSVSQKVLYNKLIQHIRCNKEIYSKEPYLKKELPKYKFKLIEIDLLEADDKSLLKLSKEGQLYLSLEEMQAIQKYYRNLGRKPTDCELEIIAQTWSEHCFHKTFKGLIEYEGKQIDGLLKSTIMRATELLNKDWCISVFDDNSGIIGFDDENAVCFKVETHNHPSALEPYGGASTGIGGVIRDVLGTGLGAKPIANTDVFCFGPPEHPNKDVPKGTMHPKRVIKGVVSGVREYGNRMGIPTVNGAVLFDKSYIANPLVYCGDVGIMPKDKCFKKVDSGDLIVAVGGKTGRDGIHGATFSSGELTHESEDVSSSAVQIGNPITEKKMVDVILRARDKNLYKALNDCGAGGFSSAATEMGEDLGLKADLEKVPLKYQGLSYDEIWISESQERMVLVVDKKNIDNLLALFSSEDVEATVIGEYTDSKKVELFYEGHQVCDLDLEFLYKGMPRFKKSASWIKPDVKEPVLKDKDNYTDVLHKLLSTYDIASKEWIIRQYDHEVQAQTVLKPLAGASKDTPNDAACIKPLYNSKKGLLISCGINPYYGMLDPYWMAVNVIDEALRQIIASGGDLKRVALLDNFCWGSPQDSHQLGGLVRASIGCFDAAMAYETPFISGKDSLNNEYNEHGKTRAIPGTLLISAMGIVEDVTRTISSDFKKAGNLIYIIGLTKDELGASAYYRLKNLIGKSLPRADIEKNKKLMDKISKATSKNLVASMHDCSEGGLAVALTEMAFGGELGAEIDMKKIPHNIGDLRNDKLLFSESMCRFITEVAPEKKEEFERILGGEVFAAIGKVCKSQDLIIKGIKGRTIIKDNVMNFKESWQKPLRW
jgi:phosphoribosylformylglycinamidine synthase